MKYFIQPVDGSDQLKCVNKYSLLTAPYFSKLEYLDLLSFSCTISLPIESNNSSIQVKHWIPGFALCDGSSHPIPITLDTNSRTHKNSLCSCTCNFKLDFTKQLICKQITYIQKIVLDLSAMLGNQIQTFWSSQKWISFWSIIQYSCTNLQRW